MVDEEALKRAREWVKRWRNRKDIGDMDFPDSERYNKTRDAILKYLEFTFEERDVLTIDDFYTVFFIWVTTLTNTKRRDKIEGSIDLNDNDNKNEFLNFIGDGSNLGIFGAGTIDFHRLTDEAMDDLSPIYEKLIEYNNNLGYQSNLGDDKFDEILDMIVNFDHPGLQCGYLTPVFHFLRPFDLPPVNGAIENNFTTWIDEEFSTKIKDYKKTAKRMKEFRDALEFPKNYRYLDNLLYGRGLKELQNILNDKNNNNGGNEMFDQITQSLTRKSQVILYGPPGTGKTYWANRYIKDYKQIDEDKYDFVTFHQSFTYEEFVEGLRAESIDDESGVNYFVRDGIFKKMCIEAIYSALKPEIEDKEIDFDNLIKKFSNYISDNPILETKEEYKFEILDMTAKKIKIKVLSTQTEYMLRVDVLKIIYDKKDLIKQVKDVSEKTDKGKGLESYYWGILNILKYLQDEDDYNLKESEEDIDYEQKKKHVLKAFENEKVRNLDYSSAPIFYLLVDEINRGNISRILGELITLLESDKRLGMENAMTVKLPYSGEAFGVPPNLHIIGTMNSTDRSIALIDSALRRRFAFREFEPKVELVSDEIPDIPLPEIFEVMNQKIEILKDRDHRIGHSYLMDREDHPMKTIDDLRKVWYGDIIPLLQEYFYNEWDKLEEILGEDFIKSDDKKSLIKNSDLLGFEDNAPIWEIEDFKDDDGEFDTSRFKSALLKMVGVGTDSEQ